jgi:hypothetical protein
MTDPAAVEHDALVRARTALGVAHARFWLALKRAQTEEGTTRTALLAQARHELERAAVLGRRAQALQAEPIPATRPEHDQPQPAQMVRQPPDSTSDRHRRNGIVVGRLSARTRS